MTQTVRSDSYLTLHYRITAQDGEEFLSTFDMSPATLQMGSGQLAENLERVLIGLPATNDQWGNIQPMTSYDRQDLPEQAHALIQEALAA